MPVADPVFPRGGSQLPKGCANLLFGRFFAENCMKMKEIRLRGDVRPLRPRGSATECLPPNNSKPLEIARIQAASSAFEPNSSMKATYRMPKHFVTPPHEIAACKKQPTKMKIKTICSLVRAYFVTHNKVHYLKVNK